MKLEQLKQYGVLDRRNLDSSQQGSATSLPTGPRRSHSPGGYGRVVNTDLEVDAVHGLHRLKDMYSVAGHGLSVVCRDPDLAYADLTTAAFLDTETTGLGMGTGTYVFLVGVGYLSRGQFRVRQFFLEGPQDEHRFLDDLSSLLAGFSVLVTFNGKAFDWPLLENRYVLHRKVVPLQDPVHVDLLHPARRLWKRRLSSCALSSIERHVLGVTRTQEDVPGYLIPHLYFRYVHSHEDGALDGVFYHNLMDVLSLATLTMHLDALVSNPHGGLVVEPLDYVSLAYAYHRVDKVELALRCYEEALRLAPRGEHRGLCLQHLAAIHKRDNRWESALDYWDKLLDEGGTDALYARVELAKYFEHVERDFLQAIDHVQYALELADIRDGGAPEASRRDLEHRLQRLLSRSIRAASWSGHRA